jgi:hypothetical protein
MVAATGANRNVYIRTGSTWTNLGGRAISGPAVVNDSGQPLVLVVGAGHKVWLRTIATRWRRFAASGYCLDRPAAAIVSGQLHVVCTGGNHQVYATAAPLPGSGVPRASTWTDLGGRATSGPAVGLVHGRVTYAVTGTNGRIYTSTGAGWSPTPWFSRAAPALVATPGGTTVLAFDSLRGRLAYTSAAPTGGWTNVSSLGGNLFAGPGIAAEPTGPVFYVEGRNQAVYLRTKAGRWISLGGVVIDGVAAAAD